jgi:trehalose 6-phosphate phosphatase
MASPLPLIAANRALFLDIDGTLIDFVARPEEARIPATLLAALERLDTSLDGAVAVVSGRAMADIDRLFAPLKFPAAGQHGAEIRLTCDGGVETFTAPTAAFDVIASRVARLIETHPGIRIEDKGRSVAFHYRGVEQYRDPLRLLLIDTVAPYEADLQILDSHLCFDVKSRRVSKGVAINALMAVPSFAGRNPIFFGDDRTDEDGFAAVNAMGGRSVLVGPARESLAPERLDTPRDLRAWLDLCAEALAARP